MNCLNRIEMQEYVDGERTPQDNEKIAQHLESCSSCRNLYSEAVNDKEFVMQVLSFSADETSLNKDIKPGRSGKTIGKKIVIAAELLLAASLLVFIFLMFKPGTDFTEVPESEKLLRELYEGSDFNKLWHDKSQAIIFQDEKGNIIDFVISD